MIELETKLYKYGELNDTYITQFKDEDELYKYIKLGIEYTEHIENESKYCGENLEKWMEKFTYNGYTYKHHLDL